MTEIKSSNVSSKKWDGKDRRKGVDWISKFINFSNIFSWIAFLIALVLFHYARPEIEYLIYHLVEQQVNVRTTWVESLKYWLEMTLYFCLCFSVLTLGLNKLRLKRRTDRQRYNTYMLIVMSLVFIITITID